MFSRGPPSPIRFANKNEWRKKEMDDKHPFKFKPQPKRRKEKDNPYSIYQTEGGECFLSFADGQQINHFIEIGKDLFAFFDEAELSDLKFLNEYDRHYEHSELSENSICKRTVMQQDNVEESYLQKEEYEELYAAIKQLPALQRRRLILYYFKGLTYRQIGEMEGCSYQTIQKSIEKAKEKIKKILL